MRPSPLSKLMPRSLRLPLPRAQLRPHFSSSKPTKLPSSPAPPKQNHFHNRTTTQSFSTPEQCKTPPDSRFFNAHRLRGRDDDALSRYPNPTSAGGILRGMDYVGTLTFALTGSVTAAQSGLDVFGCSMIGMVTAVGGGTIRDAIFLSKRPFWTSETEYIWMTIITGCLTFFAWPKVLEWRKERNSSDAENDCRKNQSNHPSYDALDGALDTMDAIGLSAFAIIGAQNGVRAGVPMAVSAICGMATSTFGGMTRDVVCGRPVRIVHSNAEVYASPALAGAVTYLLAKQAMASPAIRIGSAFAVCMGSRFVAIKHDLRLHTWDTEHDGLGVAVRRNSKDTA